MKKLFKNHVRLKSTAKVQKIFVPIYLFGLIMFILLKNTNIQGGENFNNDINSAQSSLLGHNVRHETGDVNFFIYGDKVIDPNIRTVVFHQKGFELSQPYIRYNSSEVLSLVFDDLSPNIRNFYYTIIHCDAHWQPSPLRQFEFIEGFPEAIIDNYTRSINTIVPYSQFRLELPNSTMRPKIPGNYLLKVYLNGDPEQIVFTRRFVVFEQNITINSEIRQAMLVQFRDTHQQIRFELLTNNHPVSNPRRDLRVVIKQNGRWDNAIKGIEPRSIQSTRISFEHDTQLLFEGGNEYRWFDIRSLRFRTERIDQIVSGHRYTEVFLRPDRLRAFNPFLTERDLNGRFEVRTHDAVDPHLESDYAMVHFRLQTNRAFDNHHVHVVGGLTQWVIDANNRMQFNAATRAYEWQTLLKQGFYNYKYILVNQSTGEASFMDIEGNFSMTENEYTIFVYHRQPGTVFDRLVGISHQNSFER